MRSPETTTTKNTPNKPPLCICFSCKLDKINYIWKTMTFLIVCFNSSVIVHEYSLDCIWRGFKESIQTSERYYLQSSVMYIWILAVVLLFWLWNNSIEVNKLLQILHVCWLYHLGFGILAFAAVVEGLRRWPEGCHWQQILFVIGVQYPNGLFTLLFSLIWFY